MPSNLCVLQFLHISRPTPSEYQVAFTPKTPPGLFRIPRYISRHLSGWSLKYLHLPLIDRHLLLQRIKIYGDPGFVDMTARMTRTLISFAAIAWLRHTAYSRPNLVPGVLSRPPPIFFLKEDERRRWEQGCSCHSLLNRNKKKVFRRILRHSS